VKAAARSLLLLSASKNLLSSPRLPSLAPGWESTGEGQTDMGRWLDLDMAQPSWLREGGRDGDVVLA